MPSSDKLNLAFRLMRKKGLIAYQNYSCCSNCAGIEITNEAEQRIEAGKATPESIKGCCFYHRQDAESRDAGRSFYLAYGPMDSAKHDEIGLDTAEVGKLVVEALREAGVGFEWDGNPNTRIEVTRWKEAA
jgi:hypothetical protein